MKMGDGQGFELWMSKLAGFFGALVALRWVRGGVWERVAMALGGMLLSYYVSPWLAGKLGVPDAVGMVGFLVGLFGMTLANRVWEALSVYDFAALWQRATDAIFGRK